MTMSRRDRKRNDFKAQKRRWEFDLITRTIKDVIPTEQVGKLRILEFGSGPSSGAQYLCQLGDLVVTDIYTHPLLNLPLGVEFRIADIHKTDFKDCEFDILVSNQVLEHLEDMKKAFQEMKRIGKENAYYVFGVPTATWLILTIPGQILKKLENISARMKDRFGRVSEATVGNPCRISTEKPKHVKKRRLSKFTIGGHGCYHRFFECLKAFRVRNWERVLLSNGFGIVGKSPLLTYGSTHLPIIPINRFLARIGLSSSYLFICKKSDNNR